jgi:hypothetical protein
MPATSVASPHLRPRFHIALPGGANGWPMWGYLLLVLTITISALAMALLPFCVPFLTLEGHYLTACIVALVFDQFTHFDPLNLAQLINPHRSMPVDVLAKWIYLPVLGALSLLFTLPAFSTRVEEPSGRHALAAVAGLASVLYVALLLAFPIDNLISGPCPCFDPWHAVIAAFAPLRWGYYVTLFIALYNLLANVFLTTVVPFEKWIGQPQTSSLDPLGCISTFPADCADCIGGRPLVKVAFNKAVKPATLTTSTFTLTDTGGRLVKGAVSYDRASRTATFTPSEDLAPATCYTANITAGVQDAAGHPLRSDCVWSFCTASAPTIVEVSPTSGATHVPTTTPVSVSFSEPMDQRSIDQASFFVTGPKGKVAGARLPASKGATFTPSAALAYGTTYTATVVGNSKGVKSLAGFALAAPLYEWTFTTTYRHHNEPHDHDSAKCEHCPARGYKSPCPKRVDGRCKEPPCPEPESASEDQPKPSNLSRGAYASEHAADDGPRWWSYRVWGYRVRVWWYSVWHGESERSAAQPTEHTAPLPPAPTVPVSTKQIATQQAIVQPAPMNVPASQARPAQPEAADPQERRGCRPLLWLFPPDGSQSRPAPPPADEQPLGDPPYHWPYPEPLMADSPPPPAEADAAADTPATPPGPSSTNISSWQYFSE